MMTSDKMKRLIATNATVAFTVSNGGDVEDCCVALAESQGVLMRKEMERILARPTDEELQAIEKAAAAYESRAEQRVGLENDGPDQCAEIAAVLRRLLERSGPLWIQVTDRLPEKNKPVLVASAGVVTEMEWDGYGWYYGPNEAWEGIHTVTHWTPMPEPPSDCAIGHQDGREG